MRINLSPQHLAAFLHLARTGSFSEAARLQGVTQPALSRTIQFMEDVIGNRLFDRTTRSVELTPTGRELRPIAERLVAEFTGAFGELAQFVEGRRGRIVIAALPSVAAVLLPGAIARFQRRYPAVDFLIDDDLAANVTAATSEGRADIGVTLRPPQSDTLSYRELVADEFGLVCRTDDVLAERQMVAWSSLADRPFIGMAPETSVRAMTDAAFVQAGLAIKPMYQCSFLGTTGSLVAQGLGVTALPRLTLPLLNIGNLVWRPLIKPSLRRPIGVVTRIGRSLSPAALHFLDALADETRHLSKSTAGAARGGAIKA
jgi:LysR family transcriptional regulator, carnitine catabolism transcriptional activator